MRMKLGSDISIHQSFCLPLKKEYLSCSSLLEGHVSQRLCLLETSNHVPSSTSHSCTLCEYGVNNATFAVWGAVDVLNVERLSRYEGLSWAKINNLQVVAVVYQHIVGLQVQVDDPTAVKIVHGTQNLHQQLCDVSLRIQISEGKHRQVCSN